MIHFGTKAETLERLATRISEADVLPLFHFSVTDWRMDRHGVLTRLMATGWAGRKALVVRSSAHGEDSETGSQAGRFDSVIGVAPAELGSAVDRVIASYDRRDTAPTGEDQVLIQPFLADVAFSGVAFGRDPSSGAPYAVINHAEGDDTTAVTAGRAGTRMFYFFKDAPLPTDERLAAVVRLLRELEGIFGHDRLDVEFAIAGGQLHLLQVRPLVLRDDVSVADIPTYRKALDGIADRIAAANRPHPYLEGARTVYGVMPDWNPAEIIGVRPRPLALSLYRELVTDSIWAYQRHNYGYRNLRSFPLLIHFHGLPYIDVRVSFNSFIPGDVPDELAGRLVDHYINSLISSPALHDKVEFEIVHSCYTFDLPDRLGRLLDNGFSRGDIAVLTDSLRSLTNRVIHRDNGLWRRDLARIDELERRRDKVMAADLDPVPRIYWLLEDCKRYGTLPFAGLARAGFIAMQMLESLVAVGILNQEEKAAFMSGLSTVSSTLSSDLAQLDRTTFLAKYGHLRPGTYDILSPRYDEAPDRYFRWDAIDHSGHAARRPPPFALSLDQMRRIDALLREHKLDPDIIGLFEFIEAGIRGREYAKFVFTRSLSDALSLLGKLGRDVGLNLDDMSYVGFEAIHALHAGSADIGEVLRKSVATGRESHRWTRGIVLPPLITGPDDVWSFHLPPSEPNFITQRRVTGPVRRLPGGDDDDLTDAIVMIPNADPGFDWIFSRQIAGFVTAYGGANSHMAIRASELGLPAVIGAGEALFNQWKNAELIELDNVNRHVRVLR